MKAMILLEISFTPYIPSTIVGLIGLSFGYLYFYFKNKDDKKLKEIESVEKADKLHAIQSHLSELGLHLNTSNLSADQIYSLLIRSLSAKTRKYLIIAITTVILAIIIALLAARNSSTNPEKQHQDSSNDTSNNQITNRDVWNSAPEKDQVQNSIRENKKRYFASDTAFLYYYFNKLNSDDMSNDEVNNYLDTIYSRVIQDASVIEMSDTSQTDIRNIYNFCNSITFNHKFFKIIKTDRLNGNKISAIYIKTL